MFKVMAPRASRDKVGSAQLDWANLGFEFRPTKSHIKFVWKNGEWSEVRTLKNTI